MTNHQNRWAAVGNRIVQRRIELRLHNRSDLVQISGVSEPTIRHLEQGDPRGEPSASVKARLAFGLHWMPDAIDQLLNGQEPEDLRDAANRLEKVGGSQLGQVQAEIADWEYRKRTLKSQDDGLPGEEIRQRLALIEEKLESLLQGQISGLEVQNEIRATLHERLPARSPRRAAR